MPNTPETSPMLAELARIAEEEGYTDTAAVETPAVAAEVPPVEPAAVVPVEDNSPKVYQNGDGTTITVEKTSKGWRGTLDSGTGAKPEVFYGDTKEKLFVSVATAKVHATKKIREQNRQLKLGTTAAAPAAEVTAATVAAPTASARPLSAEDRLSIQAALQADPTSAMDEYFAKRFGMTPEEVVARIQKVDKGEAAARALHMEDVARQFVAAHPAYYSHDANYTALIGLLSKTKLGTVLTAANQSQVLNALVDGGHYTVASLGEAFEELSEDGLLIEAPQVPAASATPEATPVIPQPAVSPVVTPAAPTPTESNTVRRPRAGFGLRSSEVTSFETPQADKPPSAQELSEMSDQEIDALMKSVRLHDRRRL